MKFIIRAEIKYGKFLRKLTLCARALRKKSYNKLRSDRLSRG